MLVESTSRQLLLKTLYKFYYARIIKLNSNIFMYKYYTDLI